MTGLLIRAHGGFFDVETEPGTILPCRARGRLHLDGTEPLPGDRVRWKEDEHHRGFGILTGIEPRQNVFIRPSMANLQQLVYVASAARPRTDPYLIDLMSVVAERANCLFLLCINKIDLEPPDVLSSIYEHCDFHVLPVSAETGEGVDELRRQLSGRISAFTGNSGVGKTSLLNLLLPGIDREVAGISEKHGRGRHTTRLTELFPLPESGYIADTPGFAALEFGRIADMEDAEIALCFPEFPTDRCRFPDCIHRAEPDCAVRDAVRKGTVPASRYQSYLRMLQERPSTIKK
jgi:ribosome biogenesis GTPase